MTCKWNVYIINSRVIITQQVTHTRLQYTRMHIGVRIVNDGTSLAVAAAVIITTMNQHFDFHLFHSFTFKEEMHSQAHIKKYQRHK